MLPSAGDTTGHARAIGLDDPAAVGPIERPHPPRPLTAPTVLVVGLFIEIVIFVGLVWPLGIWRSPRSITTPEPLSDMLGQSASGLAHFVTTLVLWSMAYTAVLALSRRRVTPAATRLLVAFPFLFSVTLAVTWPAASKDVYHYILEGRTISVHGLNPLTTAPAALPGDALLWILSSWEWEPSRYGPLWASIATLPTAFGGDSLRASVLGFKVIGVASFAATSLLTFATARRVQPDHALPAFVLLAWNPLFLFETSANAHNDAVMIAFTSAALYLAARRDWQFAFPALAAAVLIKFTTGLLGPLLLIWAWRTAGRDRAARRRVLSGLVLGLTLAIVCYAPLWEGAATFDALRGAAGNALNSPGWLLREALERWLTSEESAKRVVAPLLLLLFVFGYGAALRIAWAGRGSLPLFWLSGFVGITAYLLTASWWFWPWYIGWLLPLAALLVSRRVAVLAVVWSLAALVAYIPITFRPYFWGEPPDDRMPLAVVLTVFVPAALATLWLYGVRGRLARRHNQSDDHRPEAASLAL